MDKGDAVVVLSTSIYLELAHEHLNDRQTYQLLLNEPTKEAVTQFTVYLKMHKERRVITKQEYYTLLPTKMVETQRIYFLRYARIRSNLDLPYSRVTKHMRF